MDSRNVEVSSKKYHKMITILSVLIIGLSMVASLTGIFSNELKLHADIVTAFDEEVELYQKGLYAKDSVSMATQAIAQDIVTLLLGIPFMFISLILIKKKNKKGILLLTGTIGYFLYTYTSYAFISLYNSFYLVYVTIMTLSFFAFMLCICVMNTNKLEYKFLVGFPRKALSIFLFIMGFIVPACFVIGYMLKQNKQWGYFLSIVMVVKAVTLAAAVSAMAVSMKLGGVVIGTEELIIFPALMIICIFFMFRILKEVEG